MTNFTPFDDAQSLVYIPTSDDTGGIDTREIDAYRQGVEIRTNHQRFIGNQPKIWTGALDHVVNTNTVGQSTSFVEYDNSLLFEDMPEFNALAYIELGALYPLPIVLNEGPQQEEEATMEPLTIPYRKQPNTEGPFWAHRVAAAVEDGNNFDTIFKNANRTAQFIDYDDPTQIRYFLDEGANVWGSSSNGIYMEGYTTGTERLLRPFDDTTIDDIPESLDAAADLLGALLVMDVNQNGDLRPPRTRSASANTFTYGRDSAIYGTDSMAFTGMTRGT